MISDRVRIIIVHICLFLAFFLPIYSWSQYLLALIPLILYIFVSDKKLLLSWNSIVVVSLILSMTFNSFWLISDYYKTIMKVTNLCLLFALFPFFKRKGIYINQNFVILMICLVLFTQFVWLLGLKPIILLFDKIYPPTISYGQAGVEFSLNIGGRYGGIFHNPNDCSRNIIILTSMYLVFCNRKIKNDIIVLVVMCISVYLTGSRTGIIMLVFTITIYIFNNEIFSKSQKITIFTIVSITTLLFYTFLLGDNTRIKSTEFSPERSERFIWLIEVLDKIFENFYSLLFGYFYQERVALWKPGFVNGFDSDIANVIYYYGMAFVFSLFAFLYSLYKKAGKRFLYCIPPHLVMFGTGLFTSFYSAIMIFMLYAICYMESERDIELSKLE